ncbi:hypothetical protein ACFXPV_10745 [Streptomyces sp. NPDC059118]
MLRSAWGGGAAGRTTISLTSTSSDLLIATATATASAGRTAAR